MAHPLDAIYGQGNTGTQMAHPLDAIYASSNQTPQAQLQQSLSDVGMPNIPTKEPNIIQRGVKAIGSAITDPFLALGGGIANIIRPAIGQEVDRSPIPGLFGGEVNPVGSRNGQELGAVDTAKQTAGNVLMAGANLFTGGEAAPVIAGGKALVLPALKTFAKVGAIQGGAMGGGEALSEGKSPIETLLSTGVGSLLGAGTGLALGAGAGLVKDVVQKGVKQTATDLVGGIKESLPGNPFKTKTVDEIMATPETEVGKLSDKERSIYFGQKKTEVTNRYQEQIDALAKQHADEISMLDNTAAERSAAIKSEAFDTGVALDAEEKALKDAIATQSTKEAQDLKPRLVQLIKDKGNEYVKLIDEQMTPDVAQSQVTQNEIASSIRKGVNQNNPASVQQADEDIAALSKVLKKGATVRDIYETAKQLRADSFGKAAGTSRVLNKEEIQATRLINRLMTFLKDERGVDFTKANQFWAQWAPNRNLLVKKIQPYTAIGQENASFNTFARQLVSRNPKDANFIRNLEDTFGIRVSDNESQKLLAKLDENAKAKIANDVTKKAKTDELRLERAMNKEKAKNQAAVDKGELTKAKANELEALKMDKFKADLKAEQRKFIINVIKGVTGISLIGGAIPVIGSIGQGEK